MEVIEALSFILGGIITTLIMLGKLVVYAVIICIIARFGWRWYKD
jgi:hypothetical protein